MKTIIAPSARDAFLSQAILRNQGIREIEAVFRCEKQCNKFKAMLENIQHRRYEKTNNSIKLYL